MVESSCANPDALGVRNSDTQQFWLAGETSRVLQLRGTPSEEVSEEANSPENALT